MVHVSALADHFVKDPREEVRVGQVVHVVVIEVDPARQRIALSMRSDGKGGIQVPLPSVVREAPAETITVIGIRRKSCPDGPWSSFRCT